MLKLQKYRNTISACSERVSESRSGWWRLKTAATPATPAILLHFQAINIPNLHSFTTPTDSVSRSPIWISPRTTIPPRTRSRSLDPARSLALEPLTGNTRQSFQWDADLSPNDSNPPQLRSSASSDSTADSGEGGEGGDSRWSVRAHQVLVRKIKPYPAAPLTLGQARPGLDSCFNVCILNSMFHF